jgi:uncharacterized protein
MNPARPYRWALPTFLVSVGILLVGVFRMKRSYTDPALIIEVIPMQLGLTVFYAVLSSYFGKRAVGLRPPAAGALRLALPLIGLIASGLLAWGLTISRLPLNLTFDDETLVPMALGTLLVGFTEEWMFRGLLLGAFSAWFGLRRGAFLSLTLFAALHLSNALAGQSLWQTLGQVVGTFIVGAIFVLVAVRTRSIALTVLGHATHDFLILNIRHAQTYGATAAPAVFLVLGTGIFGFYSLNRLAKLEGGGLYLDDPSREERDEARGDPRPP